MGFDSGGDGFFHTFTTIFFVFFGLIAFMIVLSIIRGVKEWSTNNKQPVLTVDARIASKRFHVSDSTTNHDGHAHHHSDTTYYVTFEVESGDRMEFRLNGKEYGLLAEGDTGRLTFQGTRYHGFVRDVEKGRPSSGMEL